MSEFIFIFIILIAYALACICNRTKKKYYLWVLIILLTVLSGFRGSTVGVDTPSYYYSIEYGFPYSWMFREEGFRFISRFIMDNTGNAQLVFVLCAFITNTLILLRFWDFKDEVRLDVVILLYLLIYYGNSMNIMRQMVSVAFIFYGTRFLKQNKYIPFGILFIIAFEFHRSSLLAVGLVLIHFWEKMSKKQKQILALPFVLIILGAAAYVARYLLSDIGAYSSQAVSNINITYCYRLFVTLFALVLNYSNKRVVLGNRTSGIRENYKFDRNTVLFMLIGLLFEGLSMFFAFVGRTGLYYLMYEPIFWGTAAKRTKNGKLYTTLIFVFAIYMFMLLVFRNDGRLFPYYIYFN